MANILIIDDDPDIVRAMTVVLESKGHSVISAGSGSEGLKKLEKHTPDLIILDIMMETMDKGFDVARVIKKQQETKDIPILMLTAIKDRIGLDFKKEAGDEIWLPVDDYCEKPLSPDDLSEKVDKLLAVNQ